MGDGRSLRYFLASAAALLLCQPGSAGALTWQLQVADAQSDGIWTSLALDSQGLPHISYFDVGNGALKYTRFDGTTWRSEVVDGGLATPAGSGSALALDSQGLPHISYRYQDGPCPAGCHLRYAHFDGTAWRIETVDTVGAGYTSLALDAQGRPHISYCDCGYSEALKYAHFDGTAWQIQTVDAGGVVGYTSLKLDAQGRPHISYSGGQRLRHAYFDGTAWQLETVDDLGRFGLVLDTSLVLDGGGRPHIAYASSQGIKHAWWDGAGWCLEVTPTGGTFVSLGLDSGQRPVISFYDAWFNAGALRLVRFDGLGWHVEVVDSGAVGSFTSLKLDGQDRVHISYNAPGQGVLKYARGTPEVDLALQLNQPSFHPGDTLSLAATVTPGPVPPTADAYVAVAVPDGTLLFLQGDGSLTPDVRPLVSTWPVSPFAGELFRYPFGGGEPPGPYTWLAAFTRPGTLTLIEPLVSAPFNFGP